MPFVKPCSEEEQADEDIKMEVLSAIETMAKRGYCHEDLSWRHVGLYKTKGRIRVVLFDVAKTSTVGNNESDQNAAIVKMKNSLQLK
jgi:hypothetical protein